MSIKSKTKHISNGDYGIWSIIANKAIEKGEEEVFISLLKDFVVINKQAAKELFGEAIVDGLNKDNEGISI